MYRELMAKFFYGAATFALLSLIGLYWYGTPLPDRGKVAREILRGAPTQLPATNTTPFKAVMGTSEYTFTPRASYVLPGLVVSLHHSDSFTDISHEDDPAQSVDVCVVWGPNISTNGYRMVTYDHGDWTCYYRWETEHDPPFSGNFLSNNHIIPTSPELAKRIKDIKIGDQVMLTGELVDYAITTPDGPRGTRNTSLIRTDTGNGACEILLLRNMEVLQRNMPWREPLWYALVIFTILGGISGFYFSMPTLDPRLTKKRLDSPPDIHNPLDARNFMKAVDKEDERKPTEG